MDARLTDPRFWQVLSGIALAVTVVAFLVAIVGDTSARVAWIAFLVSGIAFAIEWALKLLRRRRGSAGI